ncbi:MAG: type III-B CRISPR module RAMP protein Cmr4 [Desulfococcaceae bacterium]|jgi:CRISPR-associated protein Cmr4|nr:type III-B CRISPR module RAMP protein Cmr4 [Desulfococcaceae bacterium]
MYNEREMLVFHVESSLHAGAGARIGHIDNPIQRETATGNPIVQANGVKGALREFFEKTEPNEKSGKIKAAFGGEDGNDGAGAAAFGEARLLFFPVRSLSGIFAYISCETVIARFQRDLIALGKSPLMSTEEDGKQKIWTPSVIGNSYQAHEQNIVQISQDGTLILEELPFDMDNDPQAGPCLEKLADLLFPNTPEYFFFKGNFSKRAVILNDEDYFYFVKYATEVEPHNRIDDKTGTVDEKTGVWYTEYLPSESILYSSLFIGTPHIKTESFENSVQVKTFLQKLDGQRSWMGGDRTTGKGRVMIHMLKEVAS